MFRGDGNKINVCFIYICMLKYLSIFNNLKKMLFLNNEYVCMYCFWFYFL